MYLVPARIFEGALDMVANLESYSLSVKLSIAKNMVKL